MKKLFNQHKKKIFYVLGTLFILNLALLFTNSGVLVSETCFQKIANGRQALAPCSKIRKDGDWPAYIDCTYWMGRGTFSFGTSKEYCPMISSL